MGKILKLKKFLKPCLAGFILIVLFFLFSSPKDQNPPLELKLSQNISSQSVFADPAKKSRPEGPEFLFLGENTLKAYLPPVIITPQVLGALTEGFEPEDVQKIIVEYIVEPGDTLWQLCQKFNISLDTILWANNLNKNSTLQPGQKLVIPPVSGVIHQVEARDTVSDIAKKYKAQMEDIISFNDLSNEADIYIGDILVVPGGLMPSPPVKYAPSLVPLATSYFICPISPSCKISQGLHWYNAIDFSHGKCGEPILAVASGKVLKVKLTNSLSPWAFGGAGNHLTILHPNGAVTLYAHLQTSFVDSGEEVSQGQIIALMGGQPGTPGAGRSTGCHLHFGVIGARNPFSP